MSDDTLKKYSEVSWYFRGNVQFIVGNRIKRNHVTYFLMKSLYMMCSDFIILVRKMFQKAIPQKSIAILLC